MYKINTSINGETVRLELVENDKVLMTEFLSINEFPTDEEAYVQFLKDYGAERYTKYQESLIEQAQKQATVEEKIAILNEFPNSVNIEV